MFFLRFKNFLSFKTYVFIIFRAVAYDVKARVAVHDQCVGEITSSNVSVKAIAIHPAFSPKSRAHDLAMLELSSLLRFDKRLHPICLPNNGMILALRNIRKFQYIKLHEFFRPHLRRSSHCCVLVIS